MAKRLGINREATAAHVVRPRDARGLLSSGHPLVELGLLRPIAIAPPCGRLVGIARIVAIEEVPRLGRDGQVLPCKKAQTVHGIQEEVLVEGDLVVVHEHHHVVAKDGGDHQAHVANGPIPTQRDGLAFHLWSDHVDGVLDHLCLAVADDERVEVGVPRAYAVDPRPCGIRTVRRGDQQDHDTQHAAHLFQRGKAGLELGNGLRDGRRMVVGSDLADVARLVVLGPVGWDDDYRIHLLPLLPIGLLVATLVCQQRHQRSLFEGMV